MKIHDNIELAEVIKGYGNDYRVEEPFHLPCDYKFYEISGVAICEESVKKMKPLTEEVNSVLDKIRAEIEQIEINGHIRDIECFRAGINTALNVIDKHRADRSEGK